PVEGLTPHKVIPLDRPRAGLEWHEPVARIARRPRAVPALIEGAGTSTRTRSPVRMLAAPHAPAASAWATLYRSPARARCTGGTEAGQIQAYIDHSAHAHSLEPWGISPLEISCDCSGGVSPEASHPGQHVAYTRCQRGRQ